MATYKLMQDIEAEDHILGPLSLRQFIFALAAAFSIYMCFIGIAKHYTFLLPIFLPPALFCGFFAVPWGGDQPTEIWALAKLRFLFKPRRRIWDQSGVKELVTITVPKKIEPVLTDGLSQTEVNSRLHALANTLDSRGWAVKGVDINTYSYPDPLAAMDTDRLISMDSMPQQVPSYDIHPADDMLDETSNPVAQQFDQMIAQSEQTHRQALINEMNSQPQPPANDRQAQPATNSNAASADYWFMSPAAAAAPRPGKAAFAPAQVQAPGSDSVVASVPETPDEAALASTLRAQGNRQNLAYTHLKTINPVGSQPVQPSPVAPSAPPSVPTSDPAILSLASNDDLNVATLAREANKTKHGEPPQDGEVVISLR